MMANYSANVRLPNGSTVKMTTQAYNSGVARSILESQHGVGNVTSVYLVSYVKS